MNFFPKKALSGAIGLALTLAVLAPISASANSSLRSEMDDMFNSMSNVTAPGAYETSRRGVITGGSVMIRNRVMNTSIVSWQPPSFNAGCGGIDLFGGSFSFINKEQFVQLARNIASNAASYAFYLALGAMSPEVRSTIDNIQKKIQELNQFFGNSCQLAQGIITDQDATFEKAREVTGGLAKSIIGGFGDIFESMSGSNGAPTNDVPATEEKKIMGNIVWNALQKKGVSGWFRYGGDNLNEVIMTVTGTVIIGELTEASDKKGESRPIQKIDSGLNNKSITFDSIVKGGDIKILKCIGNDDQCLEMTKDPVPAKVTGFSEMVVNVLIGKGGNDGVIKKIRRGEDLDTAERDFVSALPSGAGGMLFRLSRISQSVAEGFARDLSEPFGREMAYELLNEFISAAITATRNEKDNPSAQEAMDIMIKGKDELQYQYMASLQKGMKFTEVTEKYNSTLKAAEKSGVTPDLTVPTTSSAGGVAVTP